jgi:hypothetical protein
VKRKRTPSGCWYAAKTGLILIFLLVCNILLIRAAFAGALSGTDNRAFQATQFILPFFMIFLQFWIYDKIRNLFDPPGRNSAKP